MAEKTYELGNKIQSLQSTAEEILKTCDKKDHKIGNEKTDKETTQTEFHLKKSKYRHITRKQQDTKK